MNKSCIMTSFVYASPYNTPRHGRLLDSQDRSTGLASTTPYGVEEQCLQVSRQTQRVAPATGHLPRSPGSRQSDRRRGGADAVPMGLLPPAWAAPPHCQSVGVWEKKASLLFPSCQGPDRCVTLGVGTCTPKGGQVTALLSPGGNKVILW